MGVSEYIGARYVPQFAEPSEWNSVRTYEPLTIVLHEGNSYTSKQFVPMGVALTDKKYWAETGNFNAQVEGYREEVNTYKEEVNTYKEEVKTYKEEVKTYIENVNEYYFHMLGMINLHDDNYNVLQGACMLSNTTILKAMFTYTADVPSIKLVKQDINSGTILQNAIRNELSHANSLAFNKNKNIIYVAKTFENGFVVLNANTLEVINTIDTNNLVVGIACDDSFIYCAVTYNTYYKYDINTYDLIEIININNPQTYSLHYSPIDIEIHNNSIYTLTMSGVFIYSLSGNFLSYIPINRNIDNYYYITEIENFTFIPNSDNFVLGYMVYSSNNYSRTGFIGNHAFALHDNDNNKLNMHVNKSGWGLKRSLIYLDSSKNEYKKDGTINHPFTSIQEALNIALNPNVDSMLITIINNFDDEVFYLSGANALVRTAAINNNNRITFNGIMLEDNSNVEITNSLHLTAHNFSNYFSGQDDNYFIINSNSSLYTRSVTYEDSTVKKIRIDEGSLLNVSQIHPIDIANSYIIGKLEGGRYLQQNITDYLPVNSANIRYIKNALMLTNESNLNVNSINAIIPGNGADIYLLLADSTRCMLNVKNINLQQHITVGNHIINVQVTSTQELYCLVTISCSTSNINRCRIFC